MSQVKLLTVRVSEETMARVDRLARALSERAAGVLVSRHAAHVRALERGLVELEREFEIAKKGREK